MDSSSKYQSTLSVDGKNYLFYDINKAGSAEQLQRLPLTAKLLLENLLRHSHNDFVQTEDIDALIKWDNNAASSTEIAFVPSRVILQDFTGVPAVVDLAAMRDAMNDLGGDPKKINPLKPVDLVIDHSIMVDEYGSKDAFKHNTAIEVKRNKERYQFLKWGQKAFNNFKVVPPGKGIVHQVNLEYLARVTFAQDSENPDDSNKVLFPDTLVGTDSHTTMINGLGVMGWGVGGIEAEAAMLGQPVTMLIPEVVAMELTGKLAPGVTATDMVLAVTQQLREFGVVGKFVEFIGEGIQHLTVADRATIANMSPEYGATCGLFPIDEQTVTYLRLTGRSEEQIEYITQYNKAQKMWGSDSLSEAQYHDKLQLDLSSIVPSIAGPKRPQDRIALNDAASSFKKWVSDQSDLKIAPKDTIEGRYENEGGQGQEPISKKVECQYNGESFDIEDGAIVIAAITSCTNTSNPSVLVAAGLLAKNANKLGLHVHPWVKTSFAPGSQVVTEYLDKAELTEELNQLGFNLVGYGCTTCIGNSGPLPNPISKAITSGDLTVSSVLSGNRNFEGRIHPEVKTNYLASPPLVVAYALAGNMNIDLTSEPLGTSKDGKPIYLRDIWPSNEEIAEIVEKVVDKSMFTEKYGSIYDGGEIWNDLEAVDSDIYDWPESTYVKRPPFFEKMKATATDIDPIEGAKCLLKLGDSVTTDHISPAGTIGLDTPAAKYLQRQNVNKTDFNSYGSRRGNHEVMMRGTFANVRLKNQLAPGTEGGWTRLQPESEEMTVFEAAEVYKSRGTPTIVIAGKEYGTGSSRDWAAKGPLMLGIKAVIAQSYERIHRSNLIGMGILPLQFKSGQSAETYKLDGTETYDIDAISSDQKSVVVNVHRANKQPFSFDADIRIDTPNEFEYFKHGGILQFVIRKLL
ncbi:aconitate hydratase AcnA [Aliiglaciecola sp. 2_MG-2023]|uniref:aconitate hydratase AcnA n=1 Tax=unclassified Aliiglaciecola TaxID=2593648 RepID=UPI0026E3F186|nr:MULTISPECIES: aconitate hydratase AcnA [unclassified Aliiglaciecola]MDO6710532.1 aconitate hydratase AcnA [Aliiglaciecola sp. 2_MG-2023]MDO6751603.1 aconitate hydratase AcnA [Aliiglaciecola sp. 1_MG-2023]